MDIINPDYLKRLLEILTARLSNKITAAQAQFLIEGLTEQLDKAA